MGNLLSEFMSKLNKNKLAQIQSVAVALEILCIKSKIYYMGTIKTLIRLHGR